ncbi:hypothetical protein RJT34_31058 [Clitoria ternatea]|uniref:Uncharacterized protein n=1 Tax=Clitoria ternatea TaxID=43366 RepID=A0AAN9I2K6_CLITE
MSSSCLTCKVPQGHSKHCHKICARFHSVPSCHLINKSLTLRGWHRNTWKTFGTDLFCDVYQYPKAVKIPWVMITHVKSALLCFANAEAAVEARRYRELDSKAEHVQDFRIINGNKL